MEDGWGWIGDVGRRRAERSAFGGDPVRSQFLAFPHGSIPDPLVRVSWAYVPGRLSVVFYPNPTAEERIPCRVVPWMARNLTHQPARLMGYIKWSEDSKLRPDRHGLSHLVWLGCLHPSMVTRFAPYRLQAPGPIRFPLDRCALLRKPMIEAREGAESVVQNVIVRTSPLVRLSPYRGILHHHVMVSNPPGLRVRLVTC
jgi:hypothetical protein